MVCPATDGHGRKWVHRDGDLLRSELEHHFSSDAQTRSHMSNWEELSPLHKLPYFCFNDVLTCSMHSIANVGKHLLEDVQGPATMKSDPRNARLMRSVYHIRSEAGQSLKEKFWPGDTEVTNTRSPWSVTPEQFPLVLRNLWSTRPPTSFSGVLTQYFKPRNPEECAAFPKPMRSPKMADRKDMLISGLQSTSMFLGGVDDRVTYAWSRIGAAVRKLDRRVHTHILQRVPPIIAGTAHITQRAAPDPPLLCRLCPLRSLPPIGGGERRPKRRTAGRARLP